MSGLKELVSSVAPFLGSMVGGPFGAAAAKALSNLLFDGNENVSEEDIKKALSSAPPETLLKLKELDVKYKIDMEKLGIDEQKIASLDRESARDREIRLQDKLPAILAIITTVGFFAILIYLMIYGINDNAHDVVNIMLGALGTAWISIVTYYYGSSAGSDKKTILLDRKK